MMNQQEIKYSYITQQDYESVSGPSWPPFAVFVKHNNIPDLIYKEIDEMLKPPVKFEHPSFCVLPFFGYEYPKNVACCLLPKGANIEAIKTEMLSGKRPTACQPCWNLEDRGLLSDRLIKNQTVDFYYNKNIQYLYDQCTAGNSSIIQYKIDTNNVCNSTCVTCNSFSSSAWAKLEQEHGIIPIDTWQHTIEDVNKVINYSTAVSIGFRGGEPFMSKTNWDILEQLDKHNNTNCFISFTTNGSFSLTPKQQHLISQFPNINFCFSIDGINQVFEYIRYPLLFKVVEDNINWCKNRGIDVSVSYTLSNLNILYHSQTVNWFNDNNLNYIVNPVYYPLHFNPSALPKAIKQQIIEMNTIDVSGFFGDHTPDDDHQYTMFCQQISKQDSWKNIQLKYYLPELAALLDQ